MTKLNTGELLENGFLSMAHAFSVEAVVEAREALRESGFLGRGRFHNLPEAELPGAVFDFYMMWVEPLAEQLLGPKPAMVEWQPAVLEPGYPGDGWCHMDGQNYINLRDGTFDKLPGFQVLIGVPLVGVSAPRRGNLLAMKKGHRVVEAFFQKNTEQHFDADGRNVDPKATYRRLSASFTMDVAPVLGEVGSCGILHGMTPHAVDANDGPERPVLYFRVGRPPQTGLKNLTNAFHGWTKLGG